MANVFDVADFFIQVANQSEDDPITNLKLNKLLYFAQGVYLARTGKPLFVSNLEAWDFGPVVPEIYRKYKVCGKMPIQSDEDRFDQSKFTDDELDAMADVIREYGKYTGSALVRLTHLPGTPWSAAITARRTVIPRAEIEEYFLSHPVPRFTETANIPQVTVLPSAWYDPQEDAEWEAYL